MDYQTLHAKNLVDLRKLAKELSVKIPSGTAKAQLVEMLVEATTRQEQEYARQRAERAAKAAAEKKAADSAPSDMKKSDGENRSAEDAAESAAETAAAPAKKRGRPRKNPAADSASDTEKKAAAPVETASAEASDVKTEVSDAKASDSPAEQPSSKSAPNAEDETANAESSRFTRHAYVPTQRRMGARTQAASPVSQNYRRPGQPRTAGQTGSGFSSGHPRSAGQANPAGNVTQSRFAGQTPGNASPQRRSIPANQNYAPAQPRVPGQASQSGAPVRQRISEPANQSYAPTQPWSAGQGAPSGSPAQPNTFPQSNPSGTPAVDYPVNDAPQQRQTPPSEAGVRFYPRTDTVRPVDERRDAAFAAEPFETVRTRRESVYTAEYGNTNPAVPELLAGGDCADGAGVLEVHPDGYGFLRAENYLPGSNDVYLSNAQIRRFNLRTGDYVKGKTRPQREGDRVNAMLYISEVNGMSPEQNARRKPFESLIPVYPDQRLRLEPKDGRQDLALRLIDLIAPIGKGQRGMIVSQPKAGKTTLLKKLANAITENNPEAHLIVLLIDERPEEVTDMQRSISGEVVYSTFDEAPENHTRVSEMVLERAQRLVEQGKDVVVLLDSITRLARAYNLVIPPTGRSLSGGLDPGALYKPKRFFGAARNIENGGSLTVIATALVDTGSRMDDIIFEEFKGTGNMELHLDRKLSERRIFPAIDIYKSGTRREELLLSPEELDGEYQIRKSFVSSKGQDTTEQLLGLMEKTKTNADFLARLKGWMAAFEKDGFSLNDPAKNL